MQEIADIQPKPLFTDNWLRKALYKKLSLIKEASLTIYDSAGMHHFGDKNAELSAQITIQNPEFFRSLALGGSVGAGESYMNRDWQVDDLTQLIQIFVRNIDVLDDVDGGSVWAKMLFMKLLHWFSRNSKSGSKKNIAAHYDLGNDFFKLFLDSKLMYSSAIYQSEADTLEQASIRKLDTICQRLDLKDSDHLLEIGTGWGGLAIFAAQHYGCKVSTVTISKEQFAEAQQRVRAQGLEDKVEVLFKDYRDIEGQYDKVVSVEMVEAVGHQYLDGYFNKISNVLKPNGLALIQAITIREERYMQALHTVDFIKRYIFPGSFIPSALVLADSAAKSSLLVNDKSEFGQSYAKTLRDWRIAFLDNLDKVKQQGYSDSFIRMWLFYLCYCEGGFLEESINVVHMRFEKVDEAGVES